MTTTTENATNVALKKINKDRENAYGSLAIDLVAGIKKGEFGLMPRFKTLYKFGRLIIR